MSIDDYWLFASPSDENFAKKIKNHKPNLEYEFSRSSLSLSEAVLIFRGYHGGSWLEDPTWNMEMLKQLPMEVIVYSRAHAAIMAEELDAVQEYRQFGKHPNQIIAPIYHLKLQNVIYWAFQNGIEIDTAVDAYIAKTFGKKEESKEKRGRPATYHEIADAIAKLLVNAGHARTRITRGFLKELNNEAIQKLLDEFFKNSSPSDRSFQTLTDNINKRLGCQD
jgi:hypothetical protein